MARQNSRCGTPVLKNGPRGLVFDCDGVMIDSRDANRGFYNRILDAFGLGRMTAEQEDFAFRSTAMQALRRMIPKKEHGRIESVISEVIDYNRDVMPNIRLMPGFMEFMLALHGRGMPMGISTNRVREGMQRVLDFFRLPSYFSPIMTASDVEPKPSPEGLLRIAESWSILPEQVLFVGDSVDDMAAAAAAGTGFCAFRSHGITRGAVRRIIADFPRMPGYFAANGYEDLKKELAAGMDSGARSGNSTSREEA